MSSQLIDSLAGGLESLLESPSPPLALEPLPLQTGSLVESLRLEVLPDSVGGTLHVQELEGPGGISSLADLNRAAGAGYTADIRVRSGHGSQAIGIGPVAGQVTDVEGVIADDVLVIKGRLGLCGVGVRDDGGGSGRSPRALRSGGWLCDIGILRGIGRLGRPGGGGPG